MLLGAALAANVAAATTDEAASAAVWSGAPPPEAPGARGAEGPPQGRGGGGSGRGGAARGARWLGGGGVRKCAGAERRGAGMPERQTRSQGVRGSAPGQMALAARLGQTQISREAPTRAGRAARQDAESRTRAWMPDWTGHSRTTL
jgi:hypothetical protein